MQKALTEAMLAYSEAKAAFDALFPKRQEKSATVAASRVVGPGFFRKGLKRPPE